MLKVELAAVVDIGSYFVKAMYNLEGDSILAVKCYKEILKIRAAISAKYYPNLQAVSQESSSGNPALQQQLIAHGISCIQPGLLYFQEKLGSDTVHLPLKALLKARHQSGKLARWTQTIAGFDVEIRYWPGRAHGNADALSMSTMENVAAELAGGVNQVAVCCSEMAEQQRDG